MVYCSTRQPWGHATVLPNWVDLFVILIPILRACYSGWERGFLAELFSLLAWVGATVLACRYYLPLAEWVSQWIRLEQPVREFAAFLALFSVGSLILVRVVAHRLAVLLRWQSMNWVTGGFGLALGGLRGVWWVGIALLVLQATGWAYLGRSISERSVFGPRVMRVVFQSLGQVTRWMPGSPSPELLIPSLQP
ncbi:MAG: CvpA family protein [Candidatus Omnitrophica bacterium]|nr:CvpA family protein [Candidatus Omnitrophota bacterium]